MPNLIIASNSFLAMFNRSGAIHRGLQATDGPGVVAMKCRVSYWISPRVPRGLVMAGKRSNSAWKTVSPRVVLMDTTSSWTIVPFTIRVVV